MMETKRLLSSSYSTATTSFSSQMTHSSSEYWNTLQGSSPAPLASTCESKNAPFGGRPPRLLLSGKRI